MHLGEWLQPPDKGGSKTMLGRSRALLGGFRHVDPLHFIRDCLWAGAWLQDQEGAVGEEEPAGLWLVLLQVTKGQEDIEADGGISGRPFGDPGDGEGFECI